MDRNQVPYTHDERSINTLIIDTSLPKVRMAMRMVMERTGVSQILMEKVN